MKKAKYCIVILLFFLILQSLGAGGQKEAAVEEKIELELWHRWSGARQEILQEIVDTYNSSGSDITAKDVSVGGTYLEICQKVVAQKAAGKRPPDLILAGLDFLRYIHTTLGSINIDGLVSKAEAEKVKNTYIPAALNTVLIDGELVGLPFAFSTPVLYYNADLFKEAGLDPAKPPKTWDEVYTMGKQIKQKAGKYGYYMHEIDAWAVFWMIHSAGGEMFRNGKVVFNSPEGIEAFEMYTGLHETGIAPNVNDQEASAAFKAGDLGMKYHSIMRLGRISKESKFDLRVTRLPTFGKKQLRGPAGGAVFMILAEDKNRQMASWEFMKFMVSEKSINTWSKTGYVSPLKGGKPLDPRQQAAFDTLPGLVAWPNWPGENALEIEQKLRDWRLRMIRGKVKDVKEKMAQFAAEIQSLLP